MRRSGSSLLAAVGIAAALAVLAACGPRPPDVAAAVASAVRAELPGIPGVSVRASHSPSGWVLAMRLYVGDADAGALGPELLAALGAAADGSPVAIRAVYLSAALGAPPQEPAEEVFDEAAALDLAPALDAVGFGDLSPGPTGTLVLDADELARIAAGDRTPPKRKGPRWPTSLSPMPT